MKLLNLLLIASLAGSLQCVYPWDYYKNQCRRYCVPIEIDKKSSENYLKCLMGYAGKALIKKNENIDFANQTKEIKENWYRKFSKPDSHKLKTQLASQVLEYNEKDFKKNNMYKICNEIVGWDVYDASSLGYNYWLAQLLNDDKDPRQEEIN